MSKGGGAHAPIESLCTTTLVWLGIAVMVYWATAMLWRFALLFLFFQLPPILALRDTLIDVLEEHTNLLI